MEELVGRVLALRNAAHLAHWSTKSYAQHMALGDFYDALVDQIDEVVECYQGIFGIIGKVSIPTLPYNDVASTIADEAEWISTNRSKIAQEDATILNLLDELVAIYSKAFYKLRNLS